jgi:hypothetical protein
MIVDRSSEPYFELLYQGLLFLLIIANTRVGLSFSIAHYLTSQGFEKDTKADILVTLKVSGGLFCNPSR